MDWQVAYLRAVGAPTTAQNIRFLNTWQRWEGGHTHNTARYNYLNTKLALPGSWDAIGNGVRGYRSLQQGAAAFATTLEKNRGYAGLVQGLRTGDPYKLGSRVASGLQVWVSGQPNGNPGYAHKVLGSNFAAQPEPPDPGAALDAPQLGQPEQPDLSGAVLGNLGSHLRPSEQLSNLVAAVAAAGPSLPSAPAATSTPAAPPPVIPGKPVKQGGWVTVAKGADRSGVTIQQPVLAFVSKVAHVYGHPLTIGTGTNHNQYVVGTHRESAHWTGFAADIPSSGAALTRLGRAALVAAGADPKWAAKQNGGLFNIGGYQVIFNTNTGGNHYNHLHVGVRRR